MNQKQNSITFNSGQSARFFGIVRPMVEIQELFQLFQLSMH